MNKDPFEHLLDYLFELSGVDVFVEITSWSFFTLKGGNGGNWQGLFVNFRRQSKQQPLRLVPQFPFLPFSLQHL